METLKMTLDIIPSYTREKGFPDWQMAFCVRGELGAVSFVTDTRWGYSDVSHHSYKDRGQYSTRIENCIFLDKGPCYCDGSMGRGISVANTLKEKGSLAVFKCLAEEYNAVFDTDLELEQQSFCFA